MIINKKNFLYFFLIVLSILSFIYGFTVREDSAGGGKFDFRNTWNNQKIFNENSLKDSIRNTKTSEIALAINSHFPTSYILNKYLNPFSKYKNDFLKSIFILNFLIPIIFFFVIKNIYQTKSSFLLACLASILYLSPYFRTSSYWAGMENYGLLMLVISFSFFSIFLKKIKNNSRSNLYPIIFAFSFFSCACVYFDQKLLIIPLIYMCLFFQNNIDKKYYYFYLIVNFVLSLPVIALIIYWGSVVTPHDTTTRKIGNFYLEQIGYSFSIITFYLIPYILCNVNNIYNFIRNNINYFFKLFFFITIFIGIILTYPTNYYEWNSLGKGWLHKLSNILFVEQFYIKIFIYFFFYSSILIFFATSQKNYFLNSFAIYFSFLAIFILPIFQEYYDPLILIFLVLFFYRDNDLNDKLIIYHYIFSSIFLIFMNIYY